MLQKYNINNVREVQLDEINQSLPLYNNEESFEIRLVPISAGASLDELERVVNSSNNKKSSDSGILKNIRVYNNINRARYAFYN